MQQQNHSPSRTRTGNVTSGKNQSDSLALAAKTLKILEAVSPRQWIDDEQRSTYLALLANLPSWKLAKIVRDYRGPVNHRVFEFAGALVPDPEEAKPYNDLQIANYGDPEKGRYFTRTFNELFSMRLGKSQLDQALYWLMKIKYPEWEG